MRNLITVVMSVLLTMPSACEISQKPEAFVERVEDGIATVEFVKGDVYKTADISVEEFNGSTDVHSRVSVSEIEGKFYGDINCKNASGKETLYYQFRSDNDEVWWLLKPEEIGHIPNTEDKYNLYYSDNGTTEENPPCDCPKDWECECSKYDDVFFYVEKCEEN